VGNFLIRPARTSLTSTHLNALKIDGPAYESELAQLVRFFYPEFTFLCKEKAAASDTPNDAAALAGLSLAPSSEAVSKLTLTMQALQVAPKFIPIKI
jgi:hypothetical protein